MQPRNRVFRKKPGFCLVAPEADEEVERQRREQDLHPTPAVQRLRELARQREQERSQVASTHSSGFLSQLVSISLTRSTIPLAAFRLCCALVGENFAR